MNRTVYRFNKFTDDVLLRPAAKGYVAVFPGPIREGVSNFFNNLRDLPIAANNLLQGKLMSAGSDLGRFGINSTLGLAGFIDLATPMGIPRNDEDFGQTLGFWGLGSGPFLVLPFFGPSSIRDGIGLAVEMTALNPLRIDHVPSRNSTYGLRMINQRADLLIAGELMDEAALDPYIFLRDAYLQRRKSLVFDGNPPREFDPDDPENPESGTEQKSN